MASQDNQPMQTGTETVQAPSSTDGTVRNVTGYIHFNKDDDLSKIFNTLHQFRTSHGLKYSHHRDFIFFSVKSDCLSELAKVQPFRISHYRSKSEYSCSKELANKLLVVRDSFVRMTWMETEGLVQFLSRTVGRVHTQLVRRIFESVSETFAYSDYHFVRTPHQADTENVDATNVDSTNVTNTDTVVKQSRATLHVSNQNTTNHSARGGARGGARGSARGSARGGARGSRGSHSVHQTEAPVSSDGFTKVVRNKTKYNNKIHVVSDTKEAPRTRGSNRKPTTTTTSAPQSA